MLPTYENLLEEYIMRNMELTGHKWESSEQYHQITEHQEALEKRLLHMIPPKKRNKAIQILEDLDGSYNYEVDFYYENGVRDGITILKLLGVLR